MDGRIFQLNRSDGGVPKLAVREAWLTPTGLEGDRQRDLRFHGGPERPHAPQKDPRALLPPPRLHAHLAQATSRLLARLRARPPDGQARRRPDGQTTERATHLSFNGIKCGGQIERAATQPPFFFTHPARLERATCGFEGRRSIQLSYGCTLTPRMIARARPRRLMCGG